MKILFVGCGFPTELCTEPDLLCSCCCTIALDVCVRIAWSASCGRRRSAAGRLADILLRRGKYVNAASTCCCPTFLAMATRVARGTTLRIRHTAPVERRRGSLPCLRRTSEAMPSALQHALQQMYMRYTLPSCQVFRGCPRHT